MSNLYLLTNTEAEAIIQSGNAPYGDCLGAIVVANTDQEALHTYPEPDLIQLRINNQWVDFKSERFKIEQTVDYWFVRNPLVESNDPEDHYWCREKHHYDWDITNVRITCIGTTDLPTGTVVLSSNYGS